MSKTRSARLQRISEHFAEDREQASRRLAASRGALDEAEERLRELQRYLLAYQGEQPQRGAGASAASLRNRTAFLGQLHSALGQQERQVERARAAFEKQRDQWHEARAQVRAVEAAAERAAAGERRAEDRAEQRAQDEQASQRHLRDRQC